MLLIAVFIVGMALVIFGAGGILYANDGHDVFFIGILMMVMTYLGLT